MVKAAGAIFKLALAAVLVVLGIVFVPDDFIAQIERKTAAAGNFVQGEFLRRAPGLTREFSRKVRETKADADKLYRMAREEYLPSFWHWFYGIFWPTPK